MDFNHIISPLFMLLQQQSWDLALKEVGKNPKAPRETIRVAKFYDNKTDSNVNALHIACAKNAPLELVKCLLMAYSKGVSDVDSAYHRNPLHIAVINNASHKIVNALLQSYPQGAAEQDIHGRIPLHYAAKNVKNDERSLRALLKAYPEGTMVADDNGFLPLHVACRMGLNMSLVRLMIRTAPHSIIAKTNKGSTPVHCAKQYNGLDRSPELQQEIVETLKLVAEETARVVQDQGPLNVCYQSCAGSVSQASTRNQKCMDRPDHRNFHKGLSMGGGVPGQISISEHSTSSNTEEGSESSLI